MYVIVILLKYIFEWCIWYTLDWAVFKGWALRISPSYYEQVTCILETAQALGLLKHMYSFLKKKPSYDSLMYQALTYLTLHSAMICIIWTV